MSAEGEENGDAAIPLTRADIPTLVKAVAEALKGQPPHSAAGEASEGSRPTDSTAESDSSGAGEFFCSF